MQAISRDILSYAIRTLSHCFICGHVHDELIIECSKEVSLDAVCEQMGRTPSWATGLVMRADGYETEFYKNDIVNIGLHFFLKNVRPYAASCSEA